MASIPNKVIPCKFYAMWFSCKHTVHVHVYNSAETDYLTKLTGVRGEDGTALIIMTCAHTHTHTHTHLSKLDKGVKDDDGKGRGA